MAGVSAARVNESAGGGWKTLRSLGRWATRVGVVIVILLVVAVAAVPALWRFTPPVADAPARVAGIVAGHGDRQLTSLPSPNPVGVAIIATENSRFQSDFGVDPLSFLRSAFSKVTGGNDQGVATLEMQLAKNLYASGTSLGDRFRQLVLAFKLDAAYSKDQVLQMYLGSAYFGHGFYGLPSAAQGYFGLPPDRLSWGQASLLAGLVQAPSVYDPYLNLGLARQRQRHVLDRLVATDTLTPAQADAAFASPLRFR